jgi:cellulose synthase/poly-beta-1,6-N-acetylglucosamine synthase-like glycosyltransferase
MRKTLTLATKLRARPGFQQTFGALTVSILITTYNSEKFLKTCLESALQQDYPDREIIVVDNASSDGTRAVLREFETRLAISAQRYTWELAIPLAKESAKPPE